MLTRRQLLGGSVLLLPLWRARVFAAETCAVADPSPVAGALQSFGDRKPTRAARVD